MSKYLIYAWIREDLARAYVGQSARGMYRPLQHRSWYERGKLTYVHEALWSMARRPELIVLEELVDSNLLDEREWAWMAAMTEAGYDVINRLPVGVRWGTYEGRSIGGKISGKLHGPQGGKTTAALLGPEGCRERGRKGGRRAVETGGAKRRYYARSEENRRAMHRAAGLAQTKLQRKCDECGYVGNPRVMGRHQKCAGHSGITELPKLP